MNRTTLITAAALAIMVAAIIAALLMEAGSGPTFRPQDYESYDECMRNIPSEWAPNSLQRSGAEDACMYVHRR